MRKSSCARSGLDVTQPSLFDVCEDCGEPPTCFCVDCGAGMCAEVRSWITASDEPVLCVGCLFERVETWWQEVTSHRSELDITPLWLYTECEHLNTASPRTKHGAGAL